MISPWNEDSSEYDRRMIFSKLLVLVLCCQIPTHSCTRSDCDFSNFCHPYGSSWWIRHANLCFHHCSEGKKYHCARDYDSPDVFKEGCAVEKNCSAGEEPHLSFKESGKEVEDPVVYCEICEDSNYYNWKARPSSEYSECPDEKQNDCSKEKHKILCKPDDPTDERYCRCDARNGYSPINDFSNEMCSYKDYDCRDYNKCHEKNGKPQQRLLNYTCAPYCDEGFDRLSEDSDVCLPVTTTITTTRKQTSANSTTPNINTTTSKPPVPTTTQKLGCVEECHDYSICYNGTCVCPDVCTAVYEPVCGYDSESEAYRTFPSICDLRRSYCKQKQFNFYSDGECKPVSGKSNTKAIGGAVGGSLGLVLIFVLAFIVFYKSRVGRRCRDKLCPYPAMFRVVMTFTSLQFTEEIRAAGKNVGRLAITQELQTALQNLLRSLPGDIQVRIVDYQPGSLIVTFYIETDGKATEEEILQLLEDTLTRGLLNGYSVCADGFKCHKVGGPMEIIVEPSAPVENIIVPTPANTVVDCPQPNGKHLDRELSTVSAPLSEHEDVSTPNLSSSARKIPPIIVYKTTNIYKDTVIQTKGGNTQIAIGGDSPGSKNKNIKMTYNKKDAEDGEDEPMLNGEDSKDELAREDTKSESSHEASDQQSEPIEEGKGDFQVYNQTAVTFKPREGDKAENNKDGSGLSSAGCDDAFGTSITNELTNVEADSEGKPVTQKLQETQKLGTFYRRKRRISVSHESLFLEHDIEDVGNIIADAEKYKSLINAVMDQSLQYLLDNMEPVSLVDRFTVKEIFTHRIRRDILDMQTQTERTRMIVTKIRETGKQYYQLFKVCLWETKQQECLNKILEVQKENRKKIDEYSQGPKSDLDKLEECQQDDEQTNDNNTDDVFNSLCKDSSTSSQDKSQENIEKVNTSLCSDKVSSDVHEPEGKTAENTFSDPSDREQLPKHENAGPTYVPPMEQIIEQMAERYLLELKQIMERSRCGKLMGTDTIYEEFKEKCEKIKEQFPDLTTKAVVPEQLPHNLHCKENYLNTPPEFDAYKSSGKENSCLYQSVSLLLNGSENLQCSLRLLATLHAVEFFRIYKKQLLAEMDLGRLKMFFMRHINERTWKCICDIDNAESITDVCLQTLIMETACLGTDSSVLHVGFLSGTLGMNIHQHFQQYSEYGAECETVPWEKIIQDMWINSNLPDLHIFWVNYNKTAKGIMNHIVPLKPKAIS